MILWIKNWELNFVEMAKRSNNGGLKSNIISNYFPVVQENCKETPTKKTIPIDFYEKCLSDQFFQITRENCSENENELISVIGVEESFEKENCDDGECKNEVFIP